MAKILKKAEIELEITNRVFEASKNIEIDIQKRYQIRFEEIHEFLNWIMDSSVMYDSDKLIMAEMAIEQNRNHATSARTILRRMMK